MSKVCRRVQPLGRLVGVSSFATLPSRTALFADSPASTGGTPTYWKYTSTACIMATRQICDMHPRFCFTPDAVAAFFRVCEMVQVRQCVCFDVFLFVAVYCIPRDIVAGIPQGWASA